MRVRFLQDYQGKLTGPHFYRVGEVRDLEDGVAQALVLERRAEPVTERPAPAEESKPARKERRK